MLLSRNNNPFTPIPRTHNERDIVIDETEMKDMITDSVEKEDI